MKASLFLSKPMYSHAQEVTFSSSVRAVDSDSFEEDGTRGLCRAVLPEFNRVMASIG